MRGLLGSLIGNPHALGDAPNQLAADPPIPHSAKRITDFGTAVARLRAHPVAPCAERDRLIRQARACAIGANASPGLRLPN